MRDLLTMVAFALIVIVIVTVLTALLLGIGTLLTFIFAVSVWEATIVVMVVTGAVCWVVYRLGPDFLADEHVPDPIEDDEEVPPIVVTSVPFPSGRNRRRRRR